MRRTVKRLIIWGIRLVGIGAVAWIAFYLASQMATYQPYIVEDYRAVPERTCPEGAVRVELMRTLDPDAEIDSIETRTLWESDEGASTGVTEYVSEFAEGSPEGGGGTKTVTSNILRDIPSEPGEYRIVSEYVVRGKVWGFDRVDRYAVRDSGPTLTVLSADSPECEEAT